MAGSSAKAADTAAVKVTGVVLGPAFAMVTLGVRTAAGYTCKVKGSMALVNCRPSRVYVAAQLCKGSLLRMLPGAAWYAGRCRWLARGPL